MKKFLVIYYASPEAMARWANATPEQKAEGMKPWLAWKAKHEAKIIDFGAPLFAGLGREATGGWKASNKEVSGYSMVQGKSAEDVKKLFNDHPHLDSVSGTSIGVYEVASM